MMARRLVSCGVPGEKDYRNNLACVCSPKRSRRDGKPATERPSSNLNLDVGDPIDRDQKHRRRLQDALPLEALPQPDSKVQSGVGNKEYDKRTTEPRERSKNSSNPTEVPPRKEFDKRNNEQREEAKVLPILLKYLREKNLTREPMNSVKEARIHPILLK